MPEPSGSLPPSTAEAPNAIRVLPPFIVMRRYVELVVASPCIDYNVAESGERITCWRPRMPFMCT